MNQMVVLGWLCYTVLAIKFEKISQITLIYTKCVQIGLEMFEM